MLGSNQENIVVPGDLVLLYGQQLARIVGFESGKVLARREPIADARFGISSLFDLDGVQTPDFEPVTGFAWARVEVVENGKDWFEVRVNGRLVEVSLREPIARHSVNLIRKALTP